MKSDIMTAGSTNPQTLHSQYDIRALNVLDVQSHTDKKFYTFGYWGEMVKNLDFTLLNAYLAIKTQGSLVNDAPYTLVNARDAHGNTILHLLATHHYSVDKQNDLAACMNLILPFFVDHYNVENHFLESPLFLAYKHNNIVLANALADLGADLGTNFKNIIKDRIHQIRPNFPELNLSNIPFLINTSVVVNYILFELGERAQTIKSLNLSNTGLQGSHPNLINFLNHFSSLTALNLSKNIFKTSSAIISVMEELQRLRFLDHLNLDNTQLSNSVLSDVIDYLNRNKVTLSLSFEDNSNIDYSNVDDHVKFIIEKMKVSHESVLDLSNLKLKPDSLINIIKFIHNKLSRHQPPQDFSLNTLNLFNPNLKIFTDSQLLHFQNLHKSLSRLILRKNHISDNKKNESILKELFDPDIFNTSLDSVSSLHLENTNLGASDIIALTKLLRRRLELGLKKNRNHTALSNIILGNVDHTYLSDLKAELSRQKLNGTINSAKDSMTLDLSEIDLADESFRILLEEYLNNFEVDRNTITSCNLSNTNLSKIDPTIILKFLQTFPNLKTLILDNNVLGGKAWYYLYYTWLDYFIHGLDRLKKLETLSLHNTGLVASDGILLYSTLEKRLENSKFSILIDDGIDLPNMNLKKTLADSTSRKFQADIYFSNEPTSQHDPLTFTLNLENLFCNKIIHYNDIMAILKQQMVQFDKITILKLSNTQMAVHSPKSILLFLSRFPNLVELHLDQNILGGGTINSILLHLPAKLPKLRRLNLNATALCEYDLTEIKKLIHRESYLNSVSIKHNDALSSKSIAAFEIEVEKANSRAAITDDSPTTTPLWHKELRAIKTTNADAKEHNENKEEKLASEVKDFNEINILNNTASVTNVVTAVTNAFVIPNDALQPILKKKKAKIKLNNADAWYMAATDLAKKLFHLQNQLAIINEDDSVAQLKHLYQLQEFYLQLFGIGLIQSLPNNHPMAHIHTVIAALITTSKNNLGNQKIRSMGQDVLEYFANGMISGLGNKRHGSQSAASEYVVPNIEGFNGATHLAEKIAHLFHILHYLASAVAGGVGIGVTIGAAAGSHLLSHAVLQWIEIPKELGHVIHVPLNITRILEHYTKEYFKKRKEQIFLDPLILNKTLSKAFLSDRHFEEFKFSAAHFFVFRHWKTIKYQFDKNTAELIGEWISVKILEPFMLGFKIEKDEKLIDNSFLEALNIISSWTYNTSKLPFLMKPSKNIPTFTNLNSESVTLDEILSPPRFEFFTANGDSNYIDVEPLNQVSSGELKLHVGANKTYSIANTTPRLVAHCVANRFETLLISEQFHLPSREKLTEFITAHNKNFQENKDSLPLTDNISAANTTLNSDEQKQKDLKKIPCSFKIIKNLLDINTSFIQNKNFNILTVKKMQSLVKDNLLELATLSPSQNQAPTLNLQDTSDRSSAIEEKYNSELEMASARNLSRAR